MAVLSAVRRVLFSSLRAVKIVYTKMNILLLDPDKIHSRKIMEVMSS
jgi:hypothetical protein